MRNFEANKPIITFFIRQKKPFVCILARIMHSTIKNILFLILSTFAGAAMMWWIYRGFDFEMLADFFTRRTNYVWITSTLAVGIFANVLRSLRWRMLLSSADIEVSKRRAVELVFISYLINSVTPRLGELTRCLLIKRGNAKVSTRAFGTVVVEKAADVGCLIVVLTLAVSLRWEECLSLVKSLHSRIAFALPDYSLFILFGGLVILLFGITFPLRKYIKGFFQNLWAGICSITRLSRPGRFAGLCGGIWLCNFLQLYLLFPCYEALSSLTFPDALHVFAAVSLGVLLPTPAGAGPWHFAVVKTLNGVYHIPRVAAQSFALISHGLKTLLVMTLGVIGFATYYASVWQWWKRNR